MGNYFNILSIILPILLCIVIFFICELLVKRDEKVQYSFEDLQLQLSDVQGERLFCQITLYPWQRHKRREIEAYYQIGKIVFDSGHIYEISEIRGPYKCENAFFLKVIKFYINEKKKIDTVVIEGSNTYIFHDKTLYFNTKPYLREIENAYSVMLNRGVDENEQERVTRLFEELYGMSSTNIIMSQKLICYYEALDKYSETNKREDSSKIMNVIVGIMGYLRKINLEYFEEGNNMIKDNVTFNINGQVNISNGNIYAVQNNNIGIDKIDIIVRNIMQNISEITPNDAETIADAVEMVHEEIKKAEPNKKIIKNGIKLIASMISVVNGIPTLAENLRKFVEYISTLIG